MGWPLTHEQLLCNRHASFARMSIEKNCGMTSSLFRVCADREWSKSKLAKKKKAPYAAEQLCVSHLLVNCYVCCQGDQVSIIHLAWFLRRSKSTWGWISLLGIGIRSDNRLVVIWIHSSVCHLLTNLMLGLTSLCSSKRYSNDGWGSSTAAAITGAAAAAATTGHHLHQIEVQQQRVQEEQQQQRRVQLGCWHSRREQVYHDIQHKSGFISNLLGVVVNMMIQQSWRSEVIDIMDVRCDAETTYISNNRYIL